MDWQSQWTRVDVWRWHPLVWKHPDLFFALFRCFASPVSDALKGIVHPKWIVESLFIRRLILNLHDCRTHKKIIRRMSITQNSWSPLTSIVNAYFFVTEYLFLGNYPFLVVISGKIYDSQHINTFIIMIILERGLFFVRFRVKWWCFKNDFVSFCLKRTILFYRINPAQNWMKSKIRHGCGKIASAGEKGARKH